MQALGPRAAGAAKDSVDQVCLAGRASPRLKSSDETTDIPSKAFIDWEEVAL
jgi:hypothetical protein